MGKTKKTIWYSIYFIFVTLLFLFYTFPSKSVQAYIQSQAEERITKSDFSIKEVSLSFPFGLKLHQARLTPKQANDGLRLTVDSVTIQPALWSMIKGERGYHFKSQIYGGDVKGFIAFIKNKSAAPYSVNMILHRIDFKINQLMPGMVDRDLEGILNGTVQYLAKNNNLYDGTGEANLTFSKGKTDVKLAFLDHDAVEFDQMVINCELKNRRLTLGQMELKGPSLNASISGNINLNREFSMSRLNLKGEIEPLPALFQKLSDNPSIVEFLKKSLKSGKLTFTVSGTIDKPRMRII